MVTKKLAIQLIETARDVAAGLADWLNNSDTKNQGMEPGPVANKIMKMTTRHTHKYLATVEFSYKISVNYNL